MKELTIEQKAKAYDEAISLIKDYNRDEEGFICVKPENIFPELKESEYENNKRISKEISRFLKQNNGWNNEWLTWLKKQGEQKDFTSQEVMPRYSIGDVLCDKLCTTLNKDAQPNFEIVDIRNGLYICDKGSFPISQQDEYELVAKKIEQKSVNYESANIQQKDFAPKAEPKFEVEDWILYSGDHYEGVRHITKIDENGYYIERNGLPHGIIPFNHEICMRLWTIKDARNGDVLNDGTTIFIFKDLLSDGSVLSYCDYNTDSGVSDAFCPLSVNLMCSKITPATKEQRALLFKKMKEAGYEWNAEKKKLKIIDFSKHLKCNPDTPSIIEQNPA